MVECVKVHESYIEKALELFIEEQDSSIQRGVYLTPYFGEELLSLN